MGLYWSVLGAIGATPRSAASRYSECGCQGRAVCGLAVSGKRSAVGEVGLDPISVGSRMGPEAPPDLVRSAQR